MFKFHFTDLSKMMRLEMLYLCHKIITIVNIKIQNTKLLISIILLKAFDI